MSEANPGSPATRSKLAHNARILAAVLLFPILVMSALYASLRNGQNRAVAEEAIYRAQTSPAVATQIGLPIAVGWSVGGRVFSTRVTGHAHLKIQLIGPRGRGTLTDWTQKSNGKWHICSLTFRSETGPQLELVDPADTHCEPE